MRTSVSEKSVESVRSKGESDLGSRGRGFDRQVVHSDFLFCTPITADRPIRTLFLPFTRTTQVRGFLNLN